MNWSKLLANISTSSQKKVLLTADKCMEMPFYNVKIVWKQKFFGKQICNIYTPKKTMKNTIFCWQAYQKNTRFFCNGIFCIEKVCMLRSNFTFNCTTYFFVYFYSSANMNSKSWQTFRSSHCRCSVRKGVLRNFAKSTGKHLWENACEEST